MQLLTPNIGLIFWTFIVFVSIYLALKKFVWPVILNTVKEREKDISEAMETASRLKEEMAASKKEHEQFMKQAYGEKELMIREAREVSGQIIMQAKLEAKEKCEALVSNALEAIRKQKECSLAEALLSVESLATEASNKLLRRKQANKTESKSE